MKPPYPLVLIVILAISPALSGPAHAAAPVAPPAVGDVTPAPSAADLKGLVRTLEDPDQRARLIDQIQALIAAETARTNPAAPRAPAAKPLAWGDAFVALLADQAKLVGGGFAEIMTLTPVSSLARWASHTATDPEARVFWLRAVATFLGVLGGALLLERGTNAVLGGARRRLGVPPTASFWAKAASLVGEVLVRWIPILVFFGTGYALLVLALAAGGTDTGTRIVVLAVLQARALVRAIMVVVAAFLERAVGGTGVVRVDEETANYGLVWTGRLIRFAAYSYFAVGVARYMGLDETWIAIVSKALGLIFAGLLVMLLLQTRAGMARVIRGGDPGRGRSAIHGIRARMAEIWPIMAILYVVGGYGIWAADIPGGFDFLVRASVFSAVVLVAARAGAIGATRLANRLLTIPADLDRRLPGLRSRVNRYAPALIEIGRGLVYAVAGLLVLRVWGLDAIVWLSSPTGERLVGSLIVVALTAAVAVVTWEFVGLSIELYLSRLGVDGQPIERGARARTLLPLFRRTLAILLGALVVLVMLSELGINIAPLLAGAGIVGIAVGFGAQSLVKDVITGIFVLMQDAVAVGDVVTVAGTSGLVEQVSIRSIRLRDQDGTVILVPFSEVATVRNMTKDFAYALFSLGISYREDVDEVLAVLTTLAEELRADPEYQWRILETIEVLGLDQFADSAVILKFRIKTKPIQQWTVMREFNRRLKRRFDELGIEIPFPHRTLYFGVDKKGDAPPAHLVTSPNGAAPHEALEDGAIAGA